MPNLQKPNTVCALFSMDTTSAIVDIIATSREIVIDLHATSFATDGRPQDTHSLVRLSLDEATRFQAHLERAMDVVADADFSQRQTALWSNATFLTPVRRAVA